MVVRGAVYARISLDRHEGEGVARQLADCRQLAAERGWEITGEYVDNDLSAFRAKRRPEWDRLVADLAAGAVDGLIAYHPDRLYRRLADLEELIAAVEASGAQVLTVKAGEFDLSNASGRMIARILGSVSRHESERIGERVSRAKRERAAQGRPPGGGRRAFGWADDKVTLVPAEAAALRAAAERIVTGGSFYREAVTLNEAGFTTTAGKRWDISSLRRVLVSPRIVGLRAYKGEIVGDATWPGIIDRPTWEAICSLVAGRRGRPPGARWLLSGLIACPHCQRPLYGANTSTTAYICAPGPRAGCGRSSISRSPADLKVSSTVTGWLHDPVFVAEFASFLAGGADDDAGKRVELASVEQREVSLAERWARGDLTGPAYDAALLVLTRRKAELEAEITLPRSKAAVTPGDLLLAWEIGSVEDRRSVIAGVARLPVKLAPGRATRPGDRLTIVPVWQS